jgi:hypothetical protein
MNIRRLSWIGVASLLALHTCMIAGDGEFSLCLRTSYITSARIYHSPQSPDEVLRSEYSLLNGMMSYGGEIRYHFPYSVVELGIGTEYISVTRGGQFSLVAGNEAYLLPTNEGFTLVPIELSAYIVLPFSGQRVRMTMGGGTGFYLGRRTWHLVDIDAPTEKTAVSFGIHVQAGLDYFLMKNLAFRGEVKFRDPQFDVTNRFDRPFIHYQGKILPIEQAEFFSRINIDGIAFTIGIVYYF